MLGDWMSLGEHDPTYGFDSYDLTEFADRGDGNVEYLATVLTAARIDPQCLTEMAEALGEEDALTRIQRRNPLMRKSDFGEAIVVASLREFFGLQVPVEKLRYQVEHDQVLPGTDTIAIELDETGTHVVGMYFVEVKLRTTRDDDAALDAYHQLESDAESGFSEAIMFVASALYDTNRRLYTQLQRFLQGRTRRHRGSYCIGLVWDGDTWRERTLERLDELEDRIEAVESHQLLFTALEALVEDASRRAGIEVVND